MSYVVQHRTLPSIITHVGSVSSVQNLHLLRNEKYLHQIVLCLDILDYRSWRHKALNLHLAIHFNASIALSGK